MIRQHRLNAYLRGQNAAAAGLRVAGEGDPRRVGRPARRERYAMELSQLALVFAIVIHRPNLFVAASIAYERDLRAGDSRQAGRQFADDFIGELVCEGSNLRVGDFATIDFSDDRGQGGVARVIQPGLNLEAILARGEVAEGEKLGGCGGIGPRLEVHLGRSAGRLQGIITLAHQFQNSAEIEVRADDVAEFHTQRLLGRGLAHKIGHRDARLRYAEARAGAKPVLGGDWRAEKENGTTDEHR